jgi:hypothetical protein
LTVLNEIYNRSPISRLVYPSASSCRTSNSPRSAARPAHLLLRRARPSVESAEQLLQYGFRVPRRATSAAAFHRGSSCIPACPSGSAVERSFQGSRLGLRICRLISECHLSRIS